MSISVARSSGKAHPEPMAASETHRMRWLIGVLVLVSLALAYSHMVVQPLSTLVNNWLGAHGIND
jgi:hypothetical protein